MKSHRIGGRGKRRHPIRIVSSWDAALRLVDGKTVKDSEGIEGVLKVVSLGKHDKRLMHVKTERGKRTEAYQETRRKLHDDWDTDLTSSESTVPMFEALGIRFVDRGLVYGKGGRRRSMRGVKGRT